MTVNLFILYHFFDFLGDVVDELVDFFVVGGRGVTKEVRETEDSSDDPSSISSWDGDERGEGKERKGKEREGKGGKGRGGEGREGKGREGKGRKGRDCEIKGKRMEKGMKEKRMEKG